MKAIKNKILESKKVDYKEYVEDYALDTLGLENKGDVIDYIASHIHDVCDKQGVETVFYNLKELSNEMSLQIIMNLLVENSKKNRMLLAAILYYSLTEDKDNANDIADDKWPEYDSLNDKI